MRILIMIFGLVGLVLFACKSDKKGQSIKDAIIGEWEILDALRNGRRTTTLKDGFMQFEQAGQLVTNILGIETTSNYNINDQTIASDGDFNYSFKIEKLSGDTLLLSGRMKAFDMVFYLMKKKEEKQPESLNADNNSDMNTQEEQSLDK